MTFLALIDSPSIFQVLWFLLVGVLWIGFFVLEGFDFGVGMLVPFLGRSTKGRDDQATRVVINTIGPHWDGNEVWLLTAGGAMFAAFPSWYATLFSGLYIPLFLVLIGLILRGVAVEYRSKRESLRWRYTWDWLLAVGSFIPALVFGVGFAWFIIGIPVGPGPAAFDSLAVFVYPGISQGELFAIILTDGLALIGGGVFVLLFLTHGAHFVAMKTRGVVHNRAQQYAKTLGLFAAGLLLVFVIWGNLRVGPMGVVDYPWALDDGATGPYVTIAWINVVAWIVGILAVVSVVFAWVMNLVKRDGWAFIGTTIATIMMVVMVFCHMYPGLGFDNPELIDIRSAASSENTLFLMTIAALCLVPVVLAYTVWSYMFVFRRRLSVTNIPALGVTTPRHPV
ncbi:MAG: cytochrome d ubiquinol oxidase subunit II [Propionibacteriaceae bacterium]|nr:cytochrome d ubiquinol oxidase subunit II [Propionibacteriaceae bacterium]